VFVSDKKLLKADEDVGQGLVPTEHQVQARLSKETDLVAGSWEWFRTSRKLDRLPVTVEIVGVCFRELHK